MKWKTAKREVPKAIRAVVLRIVVFYVGSVLLLAMLLPSDQYKAGVSPFVTVFGQMGLGWVGDVMNMIVITAALSSCNSGLYSIGRVFRTMANNGHAPQWLTRMSKRHVPYAAILAIAAFYLVGILLNIWLGGSHAFDLALNTASIGVIFTWGAIFASQIALRHQKGRVSSLPMPGSPWTSWAGLRRAAGHHRADRLRHHDQQDRRGLPPGPLDPGHHPVLRPGAVAGLAEGQEQRAQERALQLRAPGPGPSSDDGGNHLRRWLPPSRLSRCLIRAQPRGSALGHDRTAPVEDRGAHFLLGLVVDAQVDALAFPDHQHRAG